MVSYSFGYTFFNNFEPWLQIICYLILIVCLALFFIAAAFRLSAPTMVDNNLNQSIEFLNDGVRYYRFTNYWNNFKYFISVLFKKEEKAVKFCRYEDIIKVEILAKKRYMKLGNPIAYEVYVADFRFTFNDGTSFYFWWPMILDDDAKYIAVIIEKNKKHKR